MQTITTELVDRLIDFAPSDADKAKGFATQQREGTVALFNMLARNRCAYLADEVGMGKTYVALAIMSLLRWFDPEARIVVIAPRENIQLKWVKELQNFVRVNWKVVGNRVKALHGGPVWAPVICNRIVDFAEEALLDQNRDFYLRMTSFSLGINDADERKRQRRRLMHIVPWITRSDIEVRTPEGFRETYGTTLNGIFPDTDLLIVDEAHNLKHGFGPRVSTRNQLLGFALGHKSGHGRAPHWYTPRAKRLLLLSATPFEEDYGALQRQLDVLGFGDAMLTDAGGEAPLPVRSLVDDSATEEEKRAVVERLLVRRASGLRIAGELHTKNMYRREWRQGGLEAHDEPIAMADPHEQLVVALMQKKVAEVLQSERFNNSFQIGMLSSFESFLESVGRKRGRGNAGDSEAEGEGVFDDEEQNRRARSEERRGIDTEAVRRIVRSYRERFDRALPHPKLDAAARAHRNVFETGAKSLIFVRRVATVTELASKLEEYFDAWIRDRMQAALPGLESKVMALFERYERERARRPEELARHHPEDAPGPADDPPLEVDLRWGDEERDEGGAETFFAWFFRGTGPRGVLSGAAFQTSRLGSTSSAYATLFEDDYVAWLLGASGEAVLPALAQCLGKSESALVGQLRDSAYSHFRDRSQQREGYPRLYVFEAYQAAGLRALDARGGSLGEQAAIVLEQRYPGSLVAPQEAPAGFPGPGEHLGATTVFTELVRHPELRDRVWREDDVGGDFRARFRRREQRRELFSVMARLGAAYIDLYLLAIRNMGGFEPGRQAEEQGLPARLAREYVERLSIQSKEPGFHAFRELSLANETFDQIVAVNFPEVLAADTPLTDLPRIYAATLQKQVPVGRMSGGVNKRLVRQFRMPGFPLVLVSTDVLQEGEDLHTFCRRVVHYGITWTSSAMEQRTGRIDRIGGLVQREVDGIEHVPDPEKLIQVYFPHLRDTVEVLQVRRVLKRLNRFLELMHLTGEGSEDRESHLDTARAMLEELEDVPQLTGRLEPAFPVQAEWLAGELDGEAVRVPDWQAQYVHLDSLWKDLLSLYWVEEAPSREPHIREGNVLVHVGELVSRAASGEVGEHQQLTLALRSQTAGDATLLRCTCTAKGLDLGDDEVDRLLELERIFESRKLCMTPRARKGLDQVNVHNGIVFDPATTRLAEVASLVERTTSLALAVRTGTAVTPPRRSDQADIRDLEELVDKLIADESLPWRRKGHVVEVQLTRTKRKQQVELGAAGELYRFSSVVADADRVAKSSRTRRDIARRAWRRNASTEVIGFTIDERDRLVGVVDEPASAMQPSELRFYIERVAAECDRFEYALSGKDDW